MRGRPTVRTTGGGSTPRALLSRGSSCLAASLLLLGAACGGSEQEFTLAASRSCLAGLGDVSAVSESAAKGATGGAVRLVLPDNEVVILFAADADAAAGLLPDYGVLHGQLDQLGNVVLAWESVAGGDEALAVENCIR